MCVCVCVCPYMCACVQKKHAMLDADVDKEPLFVVEFCTWNTSISLDGTWIQDEQSITGQIEQGRI